MKIIESVIGLLVSVMKVDTKQYYDETREYKHSTECINIVDASFVGIGWYMRHHHEEGEILFYHIYLMRLNRSTLNLSIPNTHYS